MEKSYTHGYSEKHWKYDERQRIAGQVMTIAEEEARDSPLYAVESHLDHTAELFEDFLKLG